MSRKNRRRQRFEDAAPASTAPVAALPEPAPERPTEAERLITGDMTYRPVGGNNPNDIGANTGIIEFQRYGGAKGGKKTTRIMIDRGVQMMNDENSPYDSIMVDTDRYFQDRNTGAFPPEPVDALIVTHAHMDHIGGISHDALRGKVLPPIYASPLAQAFLENQLILDKVEPKNWPEIRSLIPGKAVQIGDLHVMPIPVSHSIPESLALAVSSPTGALIHSGDYKTDPTVPVGPAFNKDTVAELGAKALKRYGLERFDVATVDSTRAFMPGSTPTEDAVKKEMTEIVKAHPSNRIVTAIMGSSLERIINMAKVAAETDRALVVHGPAVMKSLHALVRSDRIHRDIEAGRPVQPASKLEIKTGEIEGILARHVGRKVRVVEGRDEAVDSIPESKQLVLATGTQGEPNASLPKAARGEHKTLFLGPNDVVIRSASKIPGNEAAIEAVDGLVLGHKVKKLITTEQALVHSSGHGYAKDTDAYLEAAKARVAIPIHGSEELMQKNGDRIASERGKDLDLEVKRMRNGDRVTVGQDVIVTQTNQQARFLGIRNKIDDPNLKQFKKDYAYDPVDEFGKPLAPVPAANQSLPAPGKRAG